MIEESPQPLTENITDIRRASTAGIKRNNTGMKKFLHILQDVEKCITD
jgi:hypothetical protein